MGTETVCCSVVDIQTCVKSQTEFAAKASITNPCSINLFSYWEVRWLDIIYLCDQ